MGEMIIEAGNGNLFDHYDHFTILAGKYPHYYMVL